MTLNTSVAQSLNSLFDQHKALLADVAPFRDRLFRFLKENESNHISNVLPGREFSVRSWTDISSYSINLDIPATRHSTPGIFFVATDSDEDSYFVLPFEYLDDPDAWEAKVLRQVEHYQSMVEDAYYTAVPQQKDNSEIRVVQGYISPNNSLAAMVVRNGYNGILRDDPHAEELVMNYFVIDLDNADIVERRLM